ncbi:MAG: hypothetical protein Q6370_006840 [Candidatus Sigynarchaeota archaeon]
MSSNPRAAATCGLRRNSRSNARSDMFLFNFAKVTALNMATGGNGPIPLMPGSHVYNASNFSTNGARTSSKGTEKKIFVSTRVPFSSHTLNTLSATS